MNNVYICEDNFMTNYYTKKYGREIHSYFYFFFYNNNFLAYIRTPFFRNNDSIFSQSDYFKKLADHELNDSKDYYWTFFEIKENTLTNYDVEYEAGNWNALNVGKIKRRKFIFIDNGFILESTYRKYKTDSLELKKHIFKPYPISSKPDSTKSHIYCRLKYKTKEYRRIYPDNSPFYINPCDSK